MARPDPRKLKDEAAEAVAKGKWKKALECYLALERLEARDGAWPQKAGEMNRKLGRSEDGIACFDRAVDVFAQGGFLLKAIAVCKLILEIEPNHTATQSKLAALYSARNTGPMLPRAPAAPPPIPQEIEPSTAVPVVVAPPAVVPPAPPPRAQTRPPAPPPAPAPIVPPPVPPDAAPAVKPRRRTLPPGASLDQISLGHVVPGARRSRELEVPDAGAIFEIPLTDEGFEAAFAEALAVEPSAPIPTPVQADPPSAARATSPVAPSPAPEVSPATEAAQALFPRIPLFSSLDAPRLRMLIERVRLTRLEAGEILFSQGEAGDALYVIAEGEVAVLVDGRPVGRLGEGAFFGEIALLTSQARSATIRAVTETSLLAIDRDVVGDLIEESPEVLRVLLRFMRDRLLATLIDTSPLFAPFSGQERVALAERFRFLEVEAGIRIVTQGERTRGLYILLAGRAEVVLDGAKINELDGGELFGELSLLTHGNAVATIQSTSKVYLLELPRTVFQEIIMTHPQVLEYVNTLAEERRRELEAISRGEKGYREGRLRVV